MTIREYMNRKKQRFSIVTLACFATFIVGVMLMARSGVAGAILLAPGVAGFFACLIYAQTRSFRCPQCDGPWNALVLQTGFLPLWIDHRLRFCPYCAADIDAKDGARREHKTADPLD